MDNKLQTGPSWPITLSIILAAQVFAADLMLPLGLAVWLPYAAVVLISLWMPYRRSTLIIASSSAALIILGHFLSPGPVAGLAPLQSLFNRALGLLVIWVTALLCLQRKQAEETRQALHRLSAQLSRSLDLQEVFPAFGAAVKAHLPCDRIGVVVPEGESLVVALSVPEPPLPCHQGRAWPRDKGTAVESVLADRASRIVRDLAVEQRYTDEVSLYQEGVRATLMLPLLVGGEAVGVFFVDSRRPHVYTERHLELLAPVADQLALTLQNARLYAEVTRHAQELTRRVEERTKELQEANHRLEAASRHKSAFLAKVSHELRTPLSAILGFSEVLQNAALDPLSEKHARYVNYIHQSGQHILALINGLLDLSKVEVGQLVLHPEALVLRQAIEATLRTILPQAEAKRQGLRLQVADDLPTIRADPVRFKQILYNLLSNAVKFTPEGGFVTVSVGVRREELDGRTPAQARSAFLVAGYCVEIAVEDTGIGVKAEDLPKLFQPFTQLQSPLAERYQRTGLGLALTKELVELHGGVIRAESRGEGEGSRFTVLLPIAGPRRGPQLLVAEGDEILRATIQDTRRQPG